MENDLISRSALGIGRCNPEVLRTGSYASGWNAAIALIEAAPTVDAVEVVRCKDCNHYMTIHCTCDGCCISDYWFCADGERKVDDGE